MDRIQPQLKGLLLGFFDLIPEALLSVLEILELDMLTYGLPQIDVSDWKEHQAEYSGYYEQDRAHNPICRSSWNVINKVCEKNEGFVTITSGVPAFFMGALQSNDGRSSQCKGCCLLFEIILDRTLASTPYTCPLFISNEYGKSLTVAVTMNATGFDLE